MNRAGLVAALMAGVCSFAVAAHAQVATPDSPSVATPPGNQPGAGAQPGVATGTAAGPGAPPAAGEANQLTEIVVTAQRREQRLQDVPIAVSVVSNQQLANSNYTGLTNLQLLVPSLQYNANTGGGFQVRGVGTQSLNLSTEQDVGIVIDDVIQGIPQLTFAPPSYQALTDIDRVEVLKGPQGTLFGKNSSVGVLQVVTKRPQLDTFSADGFVSLADQGEYKAAVNANIPIGDQWAARISAFEYHHDGFVKNVYNGDELGGYDQYGARAKLLWKPNSDLDVYLIAEHVDTTSDGNGAWTLRSCGSGFGAGPLALRQCATDRPLGIRPGPENDKVALDAPTPADTQTTDASLHVDYKLGDLTLTSITAFINLRQAENVDVDNTPRSVLNIDNSLVDSRQITQEFRLASPSNRFFEYTVGAYVYHTESDYNQELAGTFTFAPDNNPVLVSNGFAGTVSGGETVLSSDSTSYAFFGQGTVHVTPKLQLIGGLRYTHDDVSAAVHVEALPNVCEFNFYFGAPCHSVSLPSAPETQDASASNVSGKVTIKYDFTPRINAYVSAATGYKGPAISYSALTPLSPVNEETSQAYEVGFKSELFDRRVVFNADAFLERYDQFQADTFVLNAQNPAASNFELANAGGLQSKGVEADATWLVTRELTLGGSVAYTPTKFTSFVIQCQAGFTNPATDPAGCYNIAGNAVFNARGYPLPQAPELSYQLNADWKHEVFDGYVLDASANWDWRSSTYTVVADRNTIQSGYGLLGLNVGIGPRDGRWQAAVFVRNLLDQNFAAAIFQTFLDNGAATGIGLPTAGYSNVPSLEAMRTVGVKLSARF